jgi:ribosomal protein S18 acetylase RimI-like enzyme
MNEFQIGYPTHADWPWITEKHIETAWQSLGMALKQMITMDVVSKGLNEQNYKLRLEHGDTNQVFMARHQNGQQAGYVWVGQVGSTFTGENQAFIINLYITLEFRGQGIGSVLMRKAEEWARLHNLDRIGLSVAVDNRVAVELYEKLGYIAETIRMYKNIS